MCDFQTPNDHHRAMIIITAVCAMFESEMGNVQCSAPFSKVETFAFALIAQNCRRRVLDEAICSCPLSAVDTPL